MKYLSGFILLCLMGMTLLFGCQQPADRITPLAEEESPLSYYHETLEIGRDGWHSVMVRYWDGQAQQEFLWKTDCQGYYLRSEQKILDENDQQIDVRPADTQPKTVAEGSGFDSLEEAVCQKVKASVAQAENLDTAGMMLLLKGNFDISRNRSRVQNICASNHVFFKKCRQFSDGYATPLLVLPIPANEMKQQIMLAKVESKNGNFPAYLMAAQIAYKNGRWQVQNVLPYLDIKLPASIENIQTGVIGLGKQKQGILIVSEVKLAVQNETRLMILTVNDQNQLLPVFSTWLAGDNSESCEDLQSEPCWGFESTMTLDKTNPEGWWDIIMLRKGNQLVKGLMTEKEGYARFMMGLQGYYVAKQ